MSTLTVEVAQDQAERMRLARVEHAALSEWHRAGRVGERPATPNLEAISVARVSGGSAMSTTTTKSPPVRFYKNGRPMGDTYNTMAHLALQSTNGVGPDGGKLNSAGLRAWLDEHGIDDPKGSTWWLTLPNGCTIGAVVEGDEVPAELTVTVNLKARRTAERVERNAAAKQAADAAVWEVHRVGERAWIIVRDGEQVTGIESPNGDKFSDKGIRSASAAKMAAAELSGRQDVEVIDKR